MRLIICFFFSGHAGSLQVPNPGLNCTCFPRRSGGGVFNAQKKRIESLRRGSGHRDSW